MNDSYEKPTKKQSISARRYQHKTDEQLYQAVFKQDKHKLNNLSNEIKTEFVYLQERDYFADQNDSAATKPDLDDLQQDDLSEDALNYKQDSISTGQIATILAVIIATLTIVKSDKLASYLDQTHDINAPFTELASSDIGMAGQKVDIILDSNHLAKNLQVVNTSLNNMTNSVLYWQAPQPVTIATISADSSNSTASSLTTTKQDNTRLDNTLLDNSSSDSSNAYNTNSDNSKPKENPRVAAKNTDKKTDTTNNLDVKLGNNLADNLTNDLTANSVSNTSKNLHDAVSNTTTHKLTTDTSISPTLDTLHFTDTNQLINIVNGDKVFFAGDSLMQGIAPWVMQKLQKNHGINSINLSKQSTGLVSTKFFDWPNTIKQTINDNPEITAIFMFIGGNDGQSIVIENGKQKKRVKFASELWNQAYLERIESIVAAARAHNIQILWIKPPVMRKTELNQQVIHLSSLYKEAIDDNTGILLDSNTILQIDTTEHKYSDTMMINKKKVRVRTSDGVHFTIKGQKIIADAVMQKITVNGTPLLN